VVSLVAHVSRLNETPVEMFTGRTLPNNNELADYLDRSAEIMVGFGQPSIAYRMTLAAQRLRRAEQSLQECFAAKESWERAHDNLREQLNDARFAAWVAGCDHTRLRETPDDDPKGRRAADILARLAEEYHADHIRRST